MMKWERVSIRFVPFGMGASNSRASVEYGS